MPPGKILLTENSRTVLIMQAEPKDEEAEDDVKSVNTNKQFLASGIATLGALSLGMCLSWSSPAIPMLQRPDSHVKISTDQGAWIGSLITLGAFVGAVPTGAIANKFGRKITLQFLSVPLFTSWLILSFSECIYGLYAARFMAGLAAGGISVAAPIYVAEIAHTSVRGTLGTFFQAQITIGLLLEYVLGGTITSFKLLALISALPPVIFLISFSLMPETPVYLYSRNRRTAARQSLAYFRGPDYNTEDEMTTIAEDLKQATAYKPKISDLVDGKAAWMGLIISLGLMVFQQFSGINAVLFYAGKIFAETGSSMGPDTCAMLVGLVQVIATLASTLLVDRMGRKILLFISSSVMCLCLLSLGVYFHLKQSQDLSHLASLPLIALTVFIVVFSLGFGPIPWMMMGEIFAPKIKGIAISICAACNWILAFTVTNQFQNLITNLGLGITFGIFGIVCGVGALFVCLLVPETKGRDIGQVQEILRGSKSRSDKCGNFCRNNCEKTTSV